MSIHRQVSNMAPCLLSHKMTRFLRPSLVIQECLRLMQSLHLLSHHNKTHLSLHKSSSNLPSVIQRHTCPAFLTRPPPILVPPHHCFAQHKSNHAPHHQLHTKNQCLLHTKTRRPINPHFSTSRTQSHLLPTIISPPPPLHSFRMVLHRPSLLLLLTLLSPPPPTPSPLYQQMQQLSIVPSSTQLLRLRR
jgi:hypothetical protein